VRAGGELELLPTIDPSPASGTEGPDAGTTQRELADRWTYYDHATRMSPAELKAWTQAKDRAGTSTEPPAQAALALVAGLALVAARRTNRRARVGQTA
jgi:hypothetical protein